MRRLVFAGAFCSSLAFLGAPSHAAYLFEENGDSAEIEFNGFTDNSSNAISGLSASLRLTLVKGAKSRGYLFSYVLTNTSTAGGPRSRVSGFAFNSHPDVSLVATLGELPKVVLDGSYPNGIDDVEICLTGSQACQGGGRFGATHKDPASGLFLLGYDQAAAFVTLSDFFVRYQSLSRLNGITSASGQDITTAVPEPATWLMMILGLGAIGVVMRKRQRTAIRLSFG